VSAAKKRLPPIERRTAMVRMTFQRLIVCAAIAAGAISLTGCTNTAEYDAKVTEAKSLLAKAEEKAVKLQKDLDAAKVAVEKADTARKDAEAKIKTLEQDNTGSKDQIKTLEQDSAGLKDQAKTLEQDNAALKVKVSQFKKDLADAKADIKKAEQAKKDAETWDITLKNKKVLTIRLESLGNNRFRLGPKNLAFRGVYEFDGKTLAMADENRSNPDLVWALKKPGLFEMVAGNYIGATMKRKTIVGAEAEPSQ
jgi:septal ring factor EnvC (AmiA/AmiB activator)